jgi:flagellar hook protein FlgE
MSIFGSLTTAVLGLTAQSRALGHISDNIANAQTLGYKRVNTSFETLVLESSSRKHSPGGLTVKPIFVNNIQGSLQQVQSPTNASIQGAGFFSVSKLSSGGNGPGQVGETVQTQTGTLNADNVYYTRVGDFELDKNRYLVNSAGFALNGWAYDSTTGQLDKDVIAPIQVNTLVDKPTSTNSIDYSANLPATPTAGVKIPTSSIQVFDTQGNARTINMNWRQQGSNDWRLYVTAPDSSSKPVTGTYTGGTTTISFGQNLSGRTALPQISTMTVQGAHTNGQDQLRVGEIFKATIDGTDYSLEVTEDNISEIGTYSGLASSLANVVNSASPSAPVLATVSGNIISFTARTPGKSFTVSQDVADKSSIANTITTGTNTAATTTAGEIQKFSITQTQIDIGDVYAITVNTGSGAQNITVTVTALNYATLQNAKGVMEALANKINSNNNIAATATASGGVLSIQRDVGGSTVAANSFTAGGGAVPSLPTTLTLADGTTVTPSLGVVNATSGNNSLVISTTQSNLSGIRQSRTVTLVGTPGDVGAEYSVSINGTPITYTTTGEETSMEEITGALANQINAMTTLPVTATSTGGVIKLTSKTAETKPVANTLTASAATVPSTLTLGGSTQIDIGDIYNVSVGGTSYSLTITNQNYTQYDTPAEVLGYFDDLLTSAGYTTTLGATTLAITLPAGGAVTASATNSADNSFSLQQTATVGETPAYIGLTFGTTKETVGTLTSISTAYVGTGTAVSSATQSAGSAAMVSFTVNYGFGDQLIKLNLGTYGQPGGVTQYAGSEINVTQFVQDGAPRGQFKDVVFNDDGEVVVNYDNGRSKRVARVPVVTFNDPNQLQREAGGVFIETQDSGKPNFNDAGNNGSGAIIANSIEGSNVDIADEFTKLIVTQRTYSANTKIVTTSDEMLQEVLNLKR